MLNKKKCEDDPYSVEKMMKDFYDHEREKEEKEEKQKEEKIQQPKTLSYASYNPKPEQIINKLSEDEIKRRVSKYKQKEKDGKSRSKSRSKSKSRYRSKFRYNL